MKRWISIILVGLLLLSGCSAGSDGAMDYNEEYAASEPAEAPMPDGVDYGDEVASDMEQGMSEQKLIKQGNIRIRVSDSLETAERIEAQVEALGGYVASSSQYSQNYDGQVYYDVDMDVRVPSASFDRLVEEIKGYGDVEHASDSVQDVTQQYIDLEARIKNLKAEEERFVAIFEQADTVEDMLAVERELARLRGDIESLEGQFRYLSNRVDYASLQIGIEEERIKSAEFEGLGFSQFLKRMGSAFSRGLYGFFEFTGNLLVQFAYMLPFILLLSAVLLVVATLTRRHRKRKGERQSEKSAEPEKREENEQA